MHLISRLAQAFTALNVAIGLLTMGAQASDHLNVTSAGQ